MSTEKLIDAQANFAFNLLLQTKSDESTIISPISISIALGGILLGAKNNTAKEIQNAIAKGIDDADEIHQHFSKIFSFINDINNGKDLENKPISFINDVVRNRKIKPAIKIYFDENLNLKDSYKNDIMKFYDGNYEFINFLNSKEAAKIINKFVEDATDNEIQNIVEPDTINTNTKMVLINALIFEGKWENPFTLKPSKMTFYSSPDITKEISVMETELYCRYISNEQFQFLEMPYMGRAFNMYLLLPHQRYGLSELLKNFNISKILDIMSANNFADGKIIIPKFHHLSSFNLNEILKNLNINDAFNEKYANFCGISGDQNLHVSNIFHKAFIHVFEEGTKAGAATVIEEEDMMFEEKGPIFEFIADHPFLYLIADKEKNIYFIGKFYN